MTLLNTENNTRQFISESLATSWLKIQIMPDPLCDIIARPGVNMQR